jgi:Mn2+/Fe2+ NRAMP family transporter
MLVGNNRTIMGRHVNDRWLNGLGWTATAVMTGATLLFFWTSL